MHYRILKVIPTSGLLTALECTKFVFGQAPPWTPLGELLQTPSWFKKDLTSKRGGKGKGGEGDEGRKGKGRGEEGRGGAGRLTQIPGSAPGYIACC